jgi:hypothetical protein
MKTLTVALLKLIEIAKILGLNENDIENAKDYLAHNELGLCFDTIITQMYEYDIEIDNDFYESISKIGKKMNLEQNCYFFMKELVRDSNNVPKPVKDELAKIIASFME